MKIPIVLAIAASLSACAAPEAQTARHLQRLDAALLRVEAGYAAARALTVLLAPWLPPERASQLGALAARVDRALAIARHATDLAARRDALRRAEAAATAYRVAAGG